MKRLALSDGKELLKGSGGMYHIVTNTIEVSFTSDEAASLLAGLAMMMEEDTMAEAKSRVDELKGAADDISN